MDPDAGSGRGLIGLRERLALYGGTLRAGPRIRGFARRGEQASAVRRDLAALSPREREVLKLLAHAMSNAELATALHGGDGQEARGADPRLQLRDRVRAVVVAYETGLVAPGES